MESYTETTALVNKIEEMKKDRKEQETWDADDEQILAFLVELYILRTSFIHTFDESKKIAGIISNIQDKMQDEKGLLVR